MESTAAALVHQRKVVPVAHGLCVHAQQRFLPVADRWHNFHQRAAPGQEDRVGEADFSVSTVDSVFARIPAWDCSTPSVPAGEDAWWTNPSHA